MLVPSPHRCLGRYQILNHPTARTDDQVAQPRLARCHFFFSILPALDFVTQRQLSAFKRPHDFASVAEDIDCSPTVLPLQSSPLPWSPKMKVRLAYPPVFAIAPGPSTLSPRPRAARSEGNSLGLILGLWIRVSPWLGLRLELCGILSDQIPPMPW